MKVSLSSSGKKKKVKLNLARRSNAASSAFTSLSSNSPIVKALMQLLDKLQIPARVNGERIKFVSLAGMVVGSLDTKAGNFGVWYIDNKLSFTLGGSLADSKKFVVETNLRLISTELITRVQRGIIRLFKSMGRKDLSY